MFLRVFNYDFLILPHLLLLSVCRPLGGPFATYQLKASKINLFNLLEFYVKLINKDMSDTLNDNCKQNTRALYMG